MEKWIAVDWGTSTFRAYLVQNNKVSDTLETKDGVKFVKRHLFEQTLISLIDRWLDDDEIIEYTTDPELILEQYDRKVDMIVDGGIGEIHPSTVVDCTDGDFEIIRQGIGELIL